MHLHTILFKTGYLKKEIGLYQTMSNMFEDTFFSKIPPNGRLNLDTLANCSECFHRKDFYMDLVAKTVEKRNGQIESLKVSQAASTQLLAIHSLLNVRLDFWFRGKTALIQYSDAMWLPELIPNSDITIGSNLSKIRLTDTKRVVDSINGKERLMETNIVKRAKESVQTNKQPLHGSSMVAAARDLLSGGTEVYSSE